MGRHARRRGRCDFRHLLPPLRRAADRPRHHPPAAADRPFPGDRPDPDRAPGRRNGGVTDGARQPSGAEGRNARARDRAGARHRRFPQVCLRADRLSALRQWDLSEEEAIAAEMRGGLEVIASGETLAGAARFHPALAVMAPSTAAATARALRPPSRWSFCVLLIIWFPPAPRSATTCGEEFADVTDLSIYSNSTLRTALNDILGGTPTA